VKKLSIGRLALLCIALSPALLAAQLHPSHYSPLAPSERITNLDDTKAQLRSYHACTCKCGCYTKDLDLQADRAIAWLRTRAAHRKPDEKLAIIIDVDETSLSNWPEMDKAGFAYDNTVFTEWVNSGQATAVASTLRLYNEAMRLNVSVIFLTGRPEEQRAATARNLQAVGFKTWEKLILRRPDQAKQTATAFKSADRAQIIAEGYTLALNIGDQWSDLKGAPEAEFSVKYPDPFYFLP